ncbi:hypothetical protein BV25DRAFT_1831914 [Artomyces pyxidatus]|uniref:Uncharacterized protein n=1 Tax=Artomyces pyxidatus TaxID=48021 RepID=A0ACB8SKH1_9AGAM|nr:hypothetical protein BV25DRAFT_1831914 [Artomyces pyxidatus]
MSNLGPATPPTRPAPASHFPDTEAEESSPVRGAATPTSSYIVDDRYYPGRDIDVAPPSVAVALEDDVPCPSTPPRNSDQTPLDDGMFHSPAKTVRPSTPVYDSSQRTGRSQSTSLSSWNSQSSTASFMSGIPGHAVAYALDGEEDASDRSLLDLGIPGGTNGISAIERQSAQEDVALEARAVEQRVLRGEDRAVDSDEVESSAASDASTEDEDSSVRPSSVHSDRTEVRAPRTTQCDQPLGSEYQSSYGWGVWVEKRVKKLIEPGAVTFAVQPLVSLYLEGLLAHQSMMICDKAIGNMERRKESSLRQQDFVFDTTLLVDHDPFRDIPLKLDALPTTRAGRLIKPTKEAQAMQLEKQEKENKAHKRRLEKENTEVIDRGRAESVASRSKRLHKKGKSRQQSTASISGTAPPDEASTEIESAPSSQQSSVPAAEGPQGRGRRRAGSSTRGGLNTAGSPRGAEPANQSDAARGSRKRKASASPSVEGVAAAPSATASAPRQRGGARPAPRQLTRAGGSSVSQTVVPRLHLQPSVGPPTASAIVAQGRREPDDDASGGASGSSERQRAAPPAGVPPESARERSDEVCSLFCEGSRADAPMASGSGSRSRAAALHDQRGRDAGGPDGDLEEGAEEDCEEVVVETTASSKLYADPGVRPHFRNIEFAWMKESSFTQSIPGPSSTPSSDNVRQKRATKKQKLAGRDDSLS